MDSASWLDIGMQVGAVLGATLRTATPLMLCALGGVISERAGIVDIGLEGKLLASAFVAASAAATGLPWPLVLVLATGIAMTLGAVHGSACIHWRGDQIVSGVALNLVATGLTVVFAVAWFGMSGRTPEVEPGQRFGPVWPAAHMAMKEAGAWGAVLANAVFAQSGLVWLAFGLVALTAWVLQATPFGLRLKAVGENPAMVEAAGIPVARLRMQAVLLGSACCGLAGVHLALSLNAGFTPLMSAGRGFMALAAVILGRWHPLGAMAACLLFGLLDALAIRLQGQSLPGLGLVPVEAIQALPYALTVLLLAGFFGRAEPPRALGKPYTKDR